MAVIFPPWTNRIPLLVAVAVPFIVGTAVAGVWYYGSPKFTDVGYQPRQPVAFSHKLHAGDLGLDCRYCHNTVERSAHAAVPPTATCMNCHRNVKTDSALLAPIRESAARGTAVPWVRVHMLPEYAYFDHSAHLGAGLGCASCHGRVDHMREVVQISPLSMAWCLECHRAPGRHVRPAGVASTEMAWQAPSDHDLRVSPVGLALEPPTHCSGCHR